MKGLLVTLLIGSLTHAFSQGTIEFQNVDVNVPVFESDGVTRLSGPQFLAQLFSGPDATKLAAIATTIFLTGRGAGYFAYGAVAVNSVPYTQTAWASGASFAQAQASGLPNSWWQSPVFGVLTGDPLPPPTLPGALIGLGNGPVFLNSVPEPSTFALACLGAAALLCVHRCQRRDTRTN